MSSYRDQLQTDIERSPLVTASSTETAYLANTGRLRHFSAFCMITIDARTRSSCTMNHVYSRIRLLVYYLLYRHRFMQQHRIDR